IAVGVDVRVPTGDEKNLLGLGATQTKVLGIASHEVGNLALHGNVSYAFTSGTSSLGDIPKELGYNVGAEVVMGRFTLAGDVIGRSLHDAVRFSDQTELDPVDTTGDTVPRSTFTPRIGTLNQILTVIGGKILVAPHLLLTANAMFQLSDGGLKAKFVPVVGFE